MLKDTWKLEKILKDRLSLTVVSEYYGIISGRPHGDGRNIGIEAEFPVISTTGCNPGVDVLQRLLREIAIELDFLPERFSSKGAPISARSATTGDLLSYEFGYSTLEFSLSPSRNLLDADQRLSWYVEKSIAMLERFGLTLKGFGLNQSPWCRMLPHVEDARYDAVFTYLNNLGESANSFFDPHFNKVICSMQTHVEVGYCDVAKYLNMINATAWVRAILFANSPLPALGERFVARDSYWKYSAFNSLPESIGTQSLRYVNCEDVFHECTKRPQYMVRRDNSFILLKRCTMGDVLSGNKIDGLRVSPCLELESFETEGRHDDIRMFRSYVDAAITPVGTIEIRSECQQPLDQLLSPAAFHAGLSACLEEVNDYMDRLDIPFSNRQLRELACSHGYEIERIVGQSVFCAVQKCLELAQQGLRLRSAGEEVLLAPVYANFQARQNPASIASRQLRKT